MAASIAILAIPVLLEQFANAFVGLADIVMTGHLPEDIATAALDGVGTGSYIRWFVGICSAAIGIGGMALISRSIGSGDLKLAESALGQTVTFGFFWGLLIAVVLWFSAPLISTLAQLSPEASGYCEQYVRIVSIGMPAMVVLFAMIMCSHGAGETTRPFLIMIVINIVNILASWSLSGVDLYADGALVLANPFGFDWDVGGIAAGTTISRLVGALLMLLVMFRGIKDLKLTVESMKPDFDVLWRIVRVGIPNFFEGLGMWAGNFAVIIIIGWIAVRTGQESGLMGAHSIAIQWEAFSFLPGFALGVAAGTLAGQYLGAQNPKMAAKSVHICLILGMLMMGGFGFIFIFAGEFLTSIISDDPTHMELTPTLLDIGGAIQIFFAMAMIIRQALRSIGDTKACMLITWLSTYLLRLPLAFYLGYVLELGLPGVWLGLCGELVFRGIFFLARFLQGRWKTIKV